MDRHESDTRAQLTAIDVKLDAIQQSLAAHGGASRNNVNLVHWALTLAGIVVAWFTGSHGLGH